jgi:GDPmannose 4,6-dehydratase
MKALIFGSSGQDGHYMHQLLIGKGLEVIGISRSSAEVRGNVADYSFVRSTIEKHRPDFIFHFAAQSTTAHKAIFENHEAIATGTLNILESCRLHVPGCRIFITGSGVQFVNSGKPIHETDPFEASSAYAVARIHSVYAARYYRSLGLKTYVGYLFHHESPFRKPGHISQLTTQAIKRIAAGSREKIPLGDIAVRKEWTFAGDVAEAMLTLVSQEHVSEAVIGTGITHSIQEWLEVCFAQVGKDWKDFVEPAGDRFTAEYAVLASNPETLHSLGWKPRISFEQLAALMLK